MRRIGPWLLGLVAACSFRIEPRNLAPVPDLAAPDGGEGPTAWDLVGASDLAGTCSGARICGPGGTTSGRCLPGGGYQPDRVCTGEGCSSGHCRRPAGAVACRHDPDCPAEHSCQLFTTRFNHYGLFCAPPPGSGSRLASCTQHADCRWNLCAPVGPWGLRCLAPCVTDQDCGPQGHCGPHELVIEGFAASSSFCGL
ncbi:MAG: hypothetical protein NZ890_13840 [Myxococcota bacterium]|nr:hypothetical protein [Myxococcota bacterium]